MVLCNYIIKRGVNEGKQCTRNGLHNYNNNKYCKQHCDSVKKFDEADKIAGYGVQFNTERKKTEKEGKAKWSMFLITINSNKNINKMTDEMKDDFKEVCEYLYDGDAQIIDFLRDRRSDDDDILEHIIDYEIQYHFEISKNSGNKLHCHSILRVKHDALLYVNMPPLRELLKSVYGTNMHVNVRGIRDNAKMMLDYIKKQNLKQAI